MLISCPNCSSVIRAPDDWAGKPCRCPKCRTRIVIPLAAVPTHGPPNEVAWQEKPPPIPPPPFEVAERSEPLALARTQECPFCASEIPAKAKKCRECGETVDVALRAAEEARR